VRPLRAWTAEHPPEDLPARCNAYHADPICNLALQTDDYARIGSAIVTLGMPVVATQEGGYAIDALGANAVALLGAIHACAIEQAPKRHE
jgi:acetoin utilization deacetylase AcuC-like enzyme